MIRTAVPEYYAPSELVHFAAGMNSGVDGGSIQLAPQVENGDVGAVEIWVAHAGEVS